MIDLFQEGSQCRTLPFFEDNRARVTLLAAPSFLAQLYYAERKLPGWGKNGGKGFDFNVLPLDLGTFKLLALRSEQRSHQTYVVADPEGESARLAQLQEIAPMPGWSGWGATCSPPWWPSSPTRCLPRSRQS